MVEKVVQVIEAAGIALLVIGAIAAFAGYAKDVLDPGTRDRSYSRLRRSLARVILLGLELLLLADIIRTIVVDASVSSVVVLGVIVIIRILLSFSLEVEIDGFWPWNKWKAEPSNEPVDPL
ncbi:DUF1622 domain-containing protein [soil metagenome]